MSEKKNEQCPCEIAGRRVECDVHDTTECDLCGENENECKCVKCAECAGPMYEDEIVWIDPKTLAASTGDNAKPYHVECAPNEY